MSSNTRTHQVELTDEQLAFVLKLTDEAVSSSDVETQNAALDLLSQLPEPGAHVTSPGGNSW